MKIQSEIIKKFLEDLPSKCKNPLDKIVGNGSKVKVMYKPYEWNFKGKKGMGLDLQAVQVIDLIEYTPREDFDAVETSSSGVDIKDDF